LRHFVYLSSQQTRVSRNIFVPSLIVTLSTCRCRAPSLTPRKEKQIQATGILLKEINIRHDPPLRVPDVLGGNDEASKRWRKTFQS